METPRLEPSSTNSDRFVLPRFVSRFLTQNIIFMWKQCLKGMLLFESDSGSRMHKICELVRVGMTTLYPRFCGEYSEHLGNVRAYPRVPAVSSLSAPSHCAS